MLSLPLAFILSQDQTLHRIFLIIYRRFARLLPLCRKRPRCALSYALINQGLCCQSNMSMNVSFSFKIPLSVFQEAGAKVEFFFRSRKLFSKFFSEIFISLFSSRSACQSLNELPLLRGAKVMPFFISGKLSVKKILNLYSLKIRLQYVKNFAVIAGAKVRTFFVSCKFIFRNFTFLFFSAFFQSCL